MFSRFIITGVALNTFLGPNLHEDECWFKNAFSCDFLQDSLWTPELECALEMFSISTYLDWSDDWDECSQNWRREVGNSFTDRFLIYLESIVSNTCYKTEYQLQLLILIRENLTFIATIPCIIWNTPHLPITIPPLGRNSPSWALFGFSFRNPSHHYRGILRLQGGMYYVPHYLGSTPKRSNGIGIISSSFVTQQNTMIHLSTHGSGTESRIFRSLSCLIGLPVSRFHVCNTYIVRTQILLQRSTSF